MKKRIASKTSKKSADTKLPVSDRITNDELDDLTEMSKDESEKILKSLEESSLNSREKLYALWHRCAHKAYGCKTWGEFCKEKLSRFDTAGNIRRIIRAARTERRLGVRIGTLSVHSTTKLHALDEDDIKIAWKTACKLHGEDGYPTADEVENAIADVKMFPAMIAYLKNTASKEQIREFANVVIDHASRKRLVAMLKRVNKRLKGGIFANDTDDGGMANKPVNISTRTSSQIDDNSDEAVDDGIDETPSRSTLKRHKASSLRPKSGQRSSSNRRAA